MELHYWWIGNKRRQCTHLISISLDLMSPMEFPINDICSSLTPDRLTLIHRSIGTDDNSVCRNCGSTRCFLFRSSTDIPSILMWLIVDDFSAFEIALKVFVASSRCIIQLQIFNVFSNLKGKRRGTVLIENSAEYIPMCYHGALNWTLKFSAEEDFPFQTLGIYLILPYENRTIKFASLIKHNRVEEMHESNPIRQTEYWAKLCSPELLCNLLEESCYALVVENERWSWGRTA